MDMGAAQASRGVRGPENLKSSSQLALRKTQALQNRRPSLEMALLGQSLGQGKRQLGVSEEVSSRVAHAEHVAVSPDTVHTPNEPVEAQKVTVHLGAGASSVWHVPELGLSAAGSPKSFSTHVCPRGQGAGAPTTSTVVVHLASSGSRGIGEPCAGGVNRDTDDSQETERISTPKVQSISTETIEWSAILDSIQTRRLTLTIWLCRCSRFGAYISRQNS